MLNKLAYFGGTKSIKTASPHWEWPPKSKGKIRAINNYYNITHTKRQKMCLLAIVIHHIMRS